MGVWRWFSHARRLLEKERFISYPNNPPMQRQVPRLNRVPHGIWQPGVYFLLLQISLALGWKFGAGMEVWRWDGSLALDWSLALE